MDSKQKKYWKEYYDRYPPSELGKPVRSYDETFSALTVIEEHFFNGAKNEKNTRD